MNPIEIEQIIRANIDKTVRVSYSDGTSQTLFVHTVDDEGFVCDIASEMSLPPRFAYWVRFADVHDVLPVAQEENVHGGILRTFVTARLAQWLIQLGNTGASVEPQNERVYVVVCSRPQQLAHVGWLLFHSHLHNLCRVVSTSGGAEARASAYPKPSSA